MPASTLACSITDPAAPNASARIAYHDSTGELRYEVTGAQTVTVDLTMMPTTGLQALRIVYETRDADGADVTDSISLAFATATESGTLPLKPGGFLMLASPGEDAGITSLSFTTTASAIVRVIAQG